MRLLGIAVLINGLFSTHAKRTPRTTVQIIFQDLHKRISAIRRHSYHLSDLDQSHAYKKNALLFRAGVFGKLVLRDDILTADGD